MARVFWLNRFISFEQKFKVTVFEKSSDILNQSSKVNQFRFHLGYHYPRSKKTIKEIKENSLNLSNFTKKRIFLAIPKIIMGLPQKDQKFLTINL